MSVPVCACVYLDYVSVCAFVTFVYVCVWVSVCARAKKNKTGAITLFIALNKRKEKLLEQLL